MFIICIFLGFKGKQPLCKKSSLGKTSLTRTQSLTPKLLPDNLIADTPTKRHSGDFGEVAMDVMPRTMEYRDVVNDEKWKSYNDKLSEHRKQVEQADKEHQRQRSETMESQFNVNKMQTMEPFNMASKIEHSGSRSSSPKQRSTPSPQQMPQQEVFLSGHLMLAKKLSDEAGETKPHKSEDRLFNRSPPSAYPSTSPLATPVKQNKPLSQLPSHSLTHQLPPQHQPLSQQFSHPVPMQQQHQRLSRQFSLQESQDARLQQGHTSACLSTASHSSRVPFQQDNFGAFGMPKNIFAAGNFSNVHTQFSGRLDHRYMGEESEHAALSRMQSAPETVFTRNGTPQKRFGRMVRQNSSSDTQLHLIGDTDLGPNEYSLFPSEVLDSSKGNQQNYQYSTGVNAQRLDPRCIRSRAAACLKPQEYRSQHDNGETRWTFEPVLGHSTYGSHCPVTQGIDAFESDYPSTPTWQNPESLKYPIQESYSYPHPVSDPFHSGGRLPFSQEHRPAERCYSGGFTFQNQTSSDLCAMSNFCESQQHSMLQTPSGKQNVGIIGQEHKQNLSRTSSASLSGHPSSQQNLATSMDPRRKSLMESAGSRPNFSEFAPIKPTDKRYNLYYHLCGLFPEPKVRKIMNDHPEETSPQELCALIIGMK